MLDNIKYNIIASTYNRSCFMHWLLPIIFTNVKCQIGYKLMNKHYVPLKRRLFKLYDKSIVVKYITLLYLGKCGREKYHTLLSVLDKGRINEFIVIRKFLISNLYNTEIKCLQWLAFLMMNVGERLWLRKQQHISFLQKYKRPYSIDESLSAEKQVEQMEAEEEYCRKHLS